MSLFRCERCGCVENTAVCHYWTRKEGEPALCTECDPEIGKWHGRFPKRPADDLVDDGKGFLISPEEAAQRKGADDLVSRLDAIKHIGLEGVARHAFGAGWSRGAEWARKETQR